MPTCLLTDKTLLQTSCGWIAPIQCGHLDDVVGINRHGSHSISPIRVEISGEETVVCCLGTRATFGKFHPQTNLITASGSLNSASELVARDTFNGVHFELAVDSSLAPSMCRNLSVIWDYLSADAIVVNDGHLIFRVLSKERPPETLHAAWLSFKNESGNRYALIKKTDFLSALERKGTKLLWELLAFIHLENDVVTFERSNYVLALLCAVHLEDTGLKYILTYDSIQHSSTINIDPNRNFSRIEQLRTAFVVPGGRTVRLTWDDRLWNPVASGFAISG